MKNSNNKPDVFVVVRQECRGSKKIGRPLPAWPGSNYDDLNKAKTACEAHKRSLGHNPTTKVFVVKNPRRLR